MGSQLPEHFDRYTILGHLATGGMAEVYLASQAGMRGFAKLVVIKRIRPELTGEPGAIEAFLDEARLVAALEHPHIVQVHEIGFVAGSYFFVMEHVDGADLRQLLEAALLRGEDISLADALYIATSVCGALHYAHEKRGPDGAPLNIIHRDMSPSNVLIGHEGAVKVCDFGIAKASTRSSETQRGVVKGKFSYMSPEQCTNSPLDKRSDVFALGILLYELTTRVHLFRGSSDFEVMRSIVEQPIPRPSTRVAGYPAELERIVMKALARDPDDRYQTARALQSDLEDFARDQRLALSSTTLAELMSRLFEQRRDSARVLTHKPQKRVAWQKSSSDRIPRVGSEAERAARSFEAQTVVLPSRVLAREVPAKRRCEVQRPPRGLGWLAASAVAGVMAAVATVAGHQVREARQLEAHVALESDAERIAAAVDAAARLAHARVDGVATTPALRGAISADAGTLAAVLADDVGFEPKAGEIVEVFRTRGGPSAEQAPASLLRLPPAAPPLGPPPPRSYRVEARNGDLVVIAGAAIAARKQHAAGVIALSAPIELAGMARRLSRYATRASLLIGGAELVLFDHGGNAWICAPVPVDGGTIDLCVSPIAAGVPDWLGSVRYASIALTLLLLAGYLVGPRRDRT